MIQFYVVRYYEKIKNTKYTSVEEKVLKTLEDVKKFVKKLPENCKLMKIEKRTVEEISYQDLF